MWQEIANTITTPQASHKAEAELTIFNFMCHSVATLSMCFHSAAKCRARFCCIASAQMPTCKYAHKSATKLLHKERAARLRGCLWSPLMHAGPISYHITDSSWVCTDVDSKSSSHILKSWNWCSMTRKSSTGPNRLTYQTCAWQLSQGVTTIWLCAHVYLPIQSMGVSSLTWSWINTPSRWQSLK